MLFSGSCGSSERRSLHCKEAPFTGDALERMDPGLGKGEAGTCNEILDRARHQDLAWFGLRHHARASMDGDAGDLVADTFALSRVEANAGLDAEASHRVADALGTAE